MTWFENIGTWRKPSVREANRVLAPLHSHHEAYLGGSPRPCPFLNFLAPLSSAGSPLPRRPGPPARSLPPPCPRCPARSPPTCGHFCGADASSGAVFKTRPEDLNEFGIGHSLYFWWLKRLFVWFSVYSVIMLPAALVFSYGYYYGKPDLEVTMLGNLGPLYFDADFSQPRQLDFAPVPLAVSKPKALYVVAMIDLGLCVLYLVTTLTINNQIEGEAKDLDERTVTIADYTVITTKLPANATEADVEAYFQEYGTIVDIEVFKKDSGLIALANKRESTHMALELAFVKMQRTPEESKLRAKYAEKIVALFQQMQHYGAEVKRIQELRAEQAGTVGACVTFMEEDGFQTCRAAHAGSHVERVVKKRRKYGDQLLDCKRAPEPSDIVHENLEYDAQQRRSRFTLTTVVTILALVLGLVFFTLIANIQRNLALKESLDCGGCPTAQNELVAGSVCYKCFCQRSSNVVSQRSFCPEEFNRYVWRIVMSFVAPLSNVVSNVVLRKLMVVLTLYEKHGTLSYEQTSLAMKIFLVQFLNTGVSPVIANAKISELDTVSRKGNVELFLSSGQFPDFLPGWYQDVGKSLAYFLAIQVVSRPAAALFTRVVLPLVKRKLSRKFSITQRQMNKMREGPDFELAIRYGELLNIIFIAVFYSTCMPLLLAFAALGFFLQFWTEKYELLRSSKKPAAYSADLALISMQVLPFAIVGHLGMGIWALSSVQDLPSNYPLPFARSLFDLAGLTDQKAALDRAMQKNTVFHTYVFVLSVIFITARLCYFLLVRPLMATLGESSQIQKAPLTGLPTFDIAFRSRLLVGLSSYSMDFNPRYTAATTKFENKDLESIIDEIKKDIKRRKRRKKRKKKVVPEEELEEEGEEDEEENVDEDMRDQEPAAEAKLENTGFEPEEFKIPEHGQGEGHGEDGDGFAYLGQYAV